MVSPIALDIPNTMDAIIPDNAAGRTTFNETSSFVAPSASAPSRMPLGTELMASSDKEMMLGNIIIPTTIPGLSALNNFNDGMMVCNTGVTKVNAKKP